MSVTCLLTLSFWPNTHSQPFSPLNGLSELIALRLDGPCLFSGRDLSPLVWILSEAFGTLLR